MKPIDLAFSPCPNDTYIFHALLHGLVDTGEYQFRSHLEDVETLNLHAFDSVYSITKLSFHAYLRLKKHYTILNAGSALGFGCGPLLIARERNIDPKNCTIAVPGQYTTAHLLLKLWQPKIKHVSITPFDTIMQGVQNGTYDAGVIIHEGRFVFQDYNLKQIIDLGQWWESETSMPIPLGCITIRNDLLKHKDSIDAIITSSIEYAHAHKYSSRDYIKKHAQELDDRVIDEHIRLYVNNFSLDLGDAGRKALEKLEEMITTRRIF